MAKSLSSGQSAMADYYRVLARAVSELATNNAHARQELYEHARTVLVAHLDTSNLKRSTQEKNKGTDGIRNGRPKSGGEIPVKVSGLGSLASVPPARAFGVAVKTTKSLPCTIWWSSGHCKVLPSPRSHACSSAKCLAPPCAADVAIEVLVFNGTRMKALSEKIRSYALNGASDAANPSLINL